MLSAVKVQLIKVVDNIPGLRSRRNAMAEPDFIATDTFAHRYVDEKVLCDALIELKFKKEDIKIKATESRGFDVNLPRKLNEKERNAIYQKFVDAAHAKRNVPRGDDEEDE
ncbi:hypothetical protein F5Y08DRAFT_86117 [Xylaria arbuscula]|uniref:Uncharacterized protein n=1 Tax=Xylaria arbuscula TaxID=114810 RepID=A0A9W8NH85_9PEZI|nr:hypothetical protein F5Y08DRAFT_86117 [Xylaria arbuscula]KAJ3576402.1 hypothetical protein NPX13_g3712 [Xylaria arbuscula]